VNSGAPQSPSPSPNNQPPPPWPGNSEAPQPPPPSPPKAVPPKPVSTPGQPFNPTQPNTGPPPPFNQGPGVPPPRIVPTPIVPPGGAPVGPTLVPSSPKGIFPKGGNPRAGAQPKQTAPPRAQAQQCGGGQPACANGQYCYDANQDKVVQATDQTQGSFGTCFQQRCQNSNGCPLKQSCIQGYCLLDYLECRRDDCPDGRQWECVGGSWLSPAACAYGLRSPRIAAM